MGKYFKLSWSGNIVRDILDDFRNDVIAELQVNDLNILQWQSSYGDFNGDGKQDILLSYFDNHWDGSGYQATQNSNGQLVLLLAQGKGKFTDGTYLLPDNGRLDSMSMQTTIADLNGDGVDDIILNNHNEDGREGAADWPSDQYAYFSTSGGFEEVDLHFRTWGRSSVSGDFNNDGLMDFAVFGWTPDNQGNISYNYLQNEDGSFEQIGTEYVGNNLFKSGDFDGDGEIEFAALGGYWSNSDAFVNQMWEINDDGTIGQRLETLEVPYEETEDGRAINRTADGVEYLDDGLHFGDSGDVNGDGADDVVAIHYAETFKRQGNNFTNLKRFDFLSIYSGVGGNGMEELNVEINGWTPPKGLLQYLHLVDWNGDGHLDIFVNSEDQNSRKVSEAEQVFLNDGTGNFDRLAQKYLASGDNGAFSEFGNYADVNSDGIMDVVVNPGGIWGAPQWDEFSESLYLGTKRIYDGTHKNPAEQGAAGFNAAYYRRQLEDAGLEIKGGMTPLEHYLAIGAEKGIHTFAPNTIVYGSSKVDKIVLREGDETVQAFAGNDVVTGGDGADTFVFGRKFGRDVILDFDAAEGDVIDLSQATGIANYKDLVDNHLLDQRENVKLTLVDGSTILLKNVDPVSLVESAFLL